MAFMIGPNLPPSTVPISHLSSPPHENLHSTPSSPSRQFSAAALAELSTISWMLSAMKGAAMAAREKALMACPLEDVKSGAQVPSFSQTTSMSAEVSLSLKKDEASTKPWTMLFQVSLPFVYAWLV